MSLQAILTDLKIKNNFTSLGIPELEIMDVEPVVIDEIYLSLSSNPGGYRSMLKNIQAYQVSKLTVTSVSIDLQTSQIQLNLKIPRISVVAKYRSSGVLIMIRSSGGGDYWGEYKDVQAEICLKVNFVLNNGIKYLQLEDLKIDFNVENIQMGVTNILYGGIIRETALNIFLNTCSQLLLREMKPAIKKKLTVKIKRFIDKLFKKIPYHLWVVD